jgi:hypothetical protein
MSTILNRRFWNPVLVLSGGLTLISGLYLLFDLKSDSITHIHEGTSILFLVACAAHLVLNWKPLLKTLGSRATAWTLLTVILLSGVGMAFSNIQIDHQPRQSYSDEQIAPR